MSESDRKVPKLLPSDLVIGTIGSLSPYDVAQTIMRNAFALVSQSFNKESNCFTLPIEDAMTLSAEIFCRCFTAVDLAAAFHNGASRTGAADVLAILQGEMPINPDPMEQGTPATWQ